jgi:hypothetical protein
MVHSIFGLPRTNVLLLYDFSRILNFKIFWAAQFGIRMLYEARQRGLGSPDFSCGVVKKVIYAVNYQILIILYSI